MNIGQLLLSIENNFQDFIGFSIQGPLGLLIGLSFFSLLLFFIRYEKKDKKGFNFNPDKLNDVGDPIETNLNLTRSLIEMSEFKKAKDCLYKVEISSDLTQKQKEKAKVLRQRLKDKENG